MPCKRIGNILEIPNSSTYSSEQSTSTTMVQSRVGYSLTLKWTLEGPINILLPDENEILLGSDYINNIKSKLSRNISIFRIFNTIA